MSWPPEYSRVMSAGLVGSIASIVMLEVGLRAQSRRTLRIVIASVVVLLGWELWSWAMFAVMVRSDYVNSEYHLVGPSQWHVFWMQAGPQFLIALIPTLVLRALATTFARLPRG